MGYAVAFILGAVVATGSLLFYAAKKNGLW